MHGSSSAAKVIALASVTPPQAKRGPTTAQIEGEIRNRLASFATWTDAAIALADRALLIRLIALYGRDAGDTFGLTLARESGNPQLMRMVAAQILDDFDLGDADAAAFMATPPTAATR